MTLKSILKALKKHGILIVVLTLFTIGWWGSPITVKIKKGLDTLELSIGNAERTGITSTGNNVVK